MIITATTLKRPIAATVLTLAVFVVGLFSLLQLDVDYLPEIIYPMIKVHIWWRGATPEEIDTNIADPIERVLSTVDNLDYLESSSIEGMYTLLVNFRFGVDVEEAYQDVIAAMGRVNRELPPDMDPPIIIKADPSQLPVMEVTLSSSQRDLVWLREFCENWLQDQLVTVPGTAGTEIVGGLQREIRVHLDPERLRAYDLGPSTIADILYQENREIFAGRVTVENHEIIARTMGEFASLEEIENVIVARNGQGLVYLKNVATVVDFHEEERVLTRFNGKNCVKLSVLKQAEANTVTVASLVKQRFQELALQIPEDIEIGYIENQGDYVKAAIEGVVEAAVTAGILVIIILFLFLGEWRQIIVMAIALPVTVIANFLLMNTAGFSLNIFSLGGLVVALGVVLDNSIVAVENITRLHRLGEADYALKGLQQVGTPILAATLSFLALVLPFLMVPGLVTLLFTELAMVVAGVVVLSLLVAWTLTPLITDRLLRGVGPNARQGPLTRSIISINQVVSTWYGRFLEQVIKFPWTTVIVFLLILATGIILIGWTGSEFLPKIDDGRVMIKVKMPAGTSVREVDRILTEIEQLVTGMPQVQSSFSLAGGKVWGLYTYEIAHEGEVDVQLVPKSERTITTQEFVNQLRPLISKIHAPGGKIPVMQMKIKGIRQIGEQEVEIKIKGTELTALFETAKKLMAVLNQADGLSGVNLSTDMTKPEYRFYVDRAKASAFGISVRSVADTLRSLVNGAVATQYREGAEYYNIRVMVPETKINNKQDLERLVIGNSQGHHFYLQDIAEVRRALGPVEIVREDQAKVVIVRADAGGISVGEANRRALALINDLELPPGVTLELGGQAQMMRDMQRTAGLILAFALFFAFVILSVQFESIKLPLIILLCVPLCLTGMIFGLFLTGLALSAPVAIGALLVIFAAVNDGVLLLAFAEELRHEGNHSVKSAVISAATIRFRPRIMTTFGEIGGFIPLALNLSVGTDLLQPMAVAAIGGLLLEILVSLFLMPCLYLITTKNRPNHEMRSE